MALSSSFLPATAPTRLFFFPNVTESVKSSLFRNSTSGKDYASACNQEILSWGDSAYVTLTSTIITSDYVPKCAMTCGTICYPAANETEIYGPEYTTTSLDYSYTLPQPSCTIRAKNCESLWSIYSSSLSSWSSGPLTTSGPYTIHVSPEPRFPACQTPCASSLCTYAAFHAELYFWPVTTSVSRDMCAKYPSGTPINIYQPQAAPNTSKC
ncbi:hypothetical protein K469DRAFT_333910 [Zopfia rhizophila CBS 207.26]|uniref:Uncharacterized protein n=1 Tax=Zopfia rhizophila CBS 207.26 TaxID=1314779 RepID=A0A6A6DIZ1_9PEZI|nr:hypothetical protein K469DRAFT_333910 [Zopfia rhizophila CBS 207.26]